MSHVERLQNSCQELGLNAAVTYNPLENELYLLHHEGKGLVGLGYDREEGSLWMGLSLKANHTRRNQGWNANTLVTKDTYQKFPFVNAKAHGTHTTFLIEEDHPFTQLYHLLEHKETPSLRSEHNWQQGYDLTYEPKKGLEGHIDWNTNSEPLETKLALCPVTAKWDDSRWVPGALQAMILPLIHQNNYGSSGFSA